MLKITTVFLPAMALGLFCLQSCTRPENSALSPRAIPTAACSGNLYLKKYGCDVSRVLEAAKTGDADAQYALGYMYYYGLGADRDQETAALWIRRAALSGHVLAKKAYAMIENGKPLGELHGNLGNHLLHGAPLSGRRGVRRYMERRPNLEMLNAQTPQAPLHSVLPRYGKAPATEKSVIPALNQPAMSAPEGATKIALPLAGVGEPSRASATSARLPDTESVESIRDLLIVPAHHYAIQLFAGKQLGPIDALIKENGLEKQVHRYAVRFNHAPWHMAVYGDFRTQAEAEHALSGLARSIRNRHPWIKSYRTIQHEIHARVIGQ
jgi:hypothetical protein